MIIYKPEPGAWPSHSLLVPNTIPRLKAPGHPREPAWLTCVVGRGSEGVDGAGGAAA